MDLKSTADRNPTLALRSTSWDVYRGVRACTVPPTQPDPACLSQLPEAYSLLVKLRTFMLALLLRVWRVCEEAKWCFRPGWAGWQWGSTAQDGLGWPAAGSPAASFDAARGKQARPLSNAGCMPACAGRALTG